MTIYVATEVQKNYVDGMIDSTKNVICEVASN